MAGGAGSALRHPRPWLQEQRCQHHEAVVREGTVRVQPERLYVRFLLFSHGIADKMTANEISSFFPFCSQRRRLHPGRLGQKLGREHLPCALPQRQCKIIRLY